VSAKHTPGPWVAEPRITDAEVARVKLLCGPRESIPAAPQVKVRRFSKKEEESKRQAAVLASRVEQLQTSTASAFGRYALVEQIGTLVNELKDTLRREERERVAQIEQEIALRLSPAIAKARGGK
jgi:hypothetical protein